jgi:uncharacterized membrane protein YgcG
MAAATISSCSTVYKSGQTPDDVYFSPVKKVEVREESRQEYSQTETQKQETREESIARRGIYDRRWRDLNDDDDYNNRYNHHCNCYCNSYGYGYYNNPYYLPRPYYYPSYGYRYVPANNTPRMVNLQAYNPTMTANNGKPGTGVGNSPGNRRTYNNNNGLGNVIRKIISPSSSNTNSSSGNDTRTYTPSSSNNGSSSSGSSSGSVPRPARGG